MIRFVFEQDGLVTDFVRRMIPHVAARGFGACKAIGVVNADNELIAGLVYHNLAPEAGIMEISGAALPGHRWLTPATLAIMYQYPFVICGCNQVAHRVLASNTRLLRQLAAIDCMFVTWPELFGPDTDGVVCLLSRRAWAENKICQRYRHHEMNLERAA